nr:MAG TPA: hypothetical protein [Caudoviricetes sp.]
MVACYLLCRKRLNPNLETDKIPYICYIFIEKGKS